MKNIPDLLTRIENNKHICPVKDYVCIGVGDYWLTLTDRFNIHPDTLWIKESVSHIMVKGWKGSSSTTNYYVTQYFYNTQIKPLETPMEKSPIQFIPAADQSPTKPTFGQVESNQFFVNTAGALCQKVSASFYHVIADKDGKPHSDASGKLESYYTIGKILPKMEKIIF